MVYDRHIRYPLIAVRLGVLRVLLALAALVLLAGCNEERAAEQPLQAQPPTATPASTQPSAVRATPTPEAADIPAATPTQARPTVEITYTVQEGDTLSQIAERFDTTVEALMQANDIDSPDLIFIGQTLKITTSGPVESAGAQPAEEQAVLPVPTAAPPQEPTPIAQAEPSPTEVAVVAEPTQVEEPPPPAAEPTPVQAEARPTPVVVNGRTYDAYNYAVIKQGQWFQYTCEFDAAWVVLKTYGLDVGLEKQLEIMGRDTSIEPYHRETRDGVVIYGGDVTQYWSGDYKKNFLARSSGQAMRKVFEHYNLKVTPVRDRPSLEAALLRGELVWIKTTVDFKPGRPATWIMPDGRSYQTVLGNDHALVVMGFNKDVVVIRDPLGTTSTNWQRKYEYEVSWERFMASWGSQEYDGLAVAPPD